MMNTKELISEYQRSSFFLYGNSDEIIKFLEFKNILTFKNLINIIEADSRHVNFTPEVVSIFFGKFSKAINAKYILDPFAKYGKIVFEIEKYNPYRIDSYSINRDEFNILKLFSGKDKNIYNGSFLNFENTKKYDLVASDLPFGLKMNYLYNDFEIKDFGLAVIAKSIDLIDEDGYIIATFPNNIVFNDRYLLELKKLEESNLYVNGVINLPIGAYSPITSILTKIIIFGKKKTERFIASIHSVDNIDAIIESFLNKRNSSIAENGIFVDKEKYEDFSIYQQEMILQKSKNFFSGELVSLSYAIKYINLPQKKANFSNVSNNIFIPMSGKNNVVTSVNNFEISNQNYFQIILNPEIVLAKYAAFFFNGPIGIEQRRKYQGLNNNRINSKIISKIPFILPDIEMQRKIIEVNQEIEEVEYKLSTIKDKFIATPVDYKNIQNKIKNINNTETLEDWIESLPHPIATILRRYITSDSYSEKQKNLLKFFEALSELLSTIFLSLAEQQEQLLKNYLNLKGINIDTLSRASFGLWVEINKIFAKKFRTMLSRENEERELLYQIFSTNNVSVIERLCDKKLYSTLDEARIKRNEWEGHSGVYDENVYRKHVEILHEELLKVRKSLGNIFEELQLIRPYRTIKKGGEYTNFVELIIGSNTVLKRKEIKTLCGTLDSDSLYVYMEDSQKVIELVPIIIMNSSKNEFHYYSKIENGSTKYISYNQNYSHDKEIDGICLLSRIQNIIKMYT
ncbi:hypothetical protein BFC22_09930 [Carnobacterium divergens]|uniref:hypothetical protein n=1 Tax=Carnobacterium divergens TaxID=2748 RepID=UPI000E70ADE6|nr:hypothetical protein BFC22_09930 [Carnobacterium divergens]